MLPRKSVSLAGDSVSGWISIFSPLPPNTIIPTRAIGTSRWIAWINCAILALTSSMISLIEPVPSITSTTSSPLRLQFADKSAEARADTVAVARADAAATPDSDSAAARGAHVIVGQADGLRGIHRLRRFLLRGGVRHRHFGHVEILHLVAAAAAATRLEVHHDQLAPTLLVHRDDQEQQDEDVNRDRERERADHQPQSVAKFLQTANIGGVFLAVYLGCGFFLRCRPIQHESRNEHRN